MVVVRLVIVIVLSVFSVGLFMWILLWVVLFVLFVLVFCEWIGVGVGFGRSG